MTVELLDHTPPSIDRAFGNAEVIDLLKKWLTIAEQAKLNFMAVVATEPDPWRSAYIKLRKGRRVKCGPKGTAMPLGLSAGATTELPVQA